MKKNVRLLISASAVLAHTCAFADSSQPARLNEVVIQSSPLQQSLNDAAIPATVLQRSDIQLRDRSSLGSVLSAEPGVSSSSFGPGTGRPVIRGQSGDRVRILQSGMGTQDVSNTSPDHPVSIQTDFADTIEVIRGPATLLYGANAIGGLVNVFDGRIPTQKQEKPLSGFLESRGSSADKERSGSARFSFAPQENIAVRLDGSARVTDDISIPGFARTSQVRAEQPDLEYPEPKGKLSFSDSSSNNLTLGTSYLLDNGYIGFAASQLNQEYGVPNGENDISIDAKSDRFDLHSQFRDISEYVSSITTKLAKTDYKHTEYEGTEAGTRFDNDGEEARIDIKHHKTGPLSGVFGYQYQSSSFGALGEEAFQPPTDSTTHSAFLFEEAFLTDYLSLQSGARMDWSDTTTNGFTPSDDRQQRRTDNPSFSLGFSFLPNEDYTTALTFAHTQRAPSGQELFAQGPHIATAAYEIGDANLRAEQSNGIDLSIKRNTGIVRGGVNLFTTRYSNFITLNKYSEIIDDLPVYRFENTDARFYGIESTISFVPVEDSNNLLQFDFQPDYVNAQDTQANNPLPRIPPFRIRSGITYKRENIGNVRLELQHALRQDRISELETETPSYNLLNLHFSKNFSLFNNDCTTYLSATNLLNEKIRDHTSFIKDIAPRAGVSVTVGLRWVF